MRVVSKLLVLRTRQIVATNFIDNGSVSESSAGAAVRP